MAHDQLVTGDGPHELLHTLRPQGYGGRSPADIADPVIEPLWMGIRALGAVDPSSARLVDDQADPIVEVDAILGALVGGLRATGLVVDGFVTKQAVGHEVDVYEWSKETPSLGSLIGLRRNRAADTVALREEALDAITFDPDDEIAFVATDLLWLDGTPLLDIPLLERRRLLESTLVESDSVRLGIHVRPPIGTWVGSWRAQGFRGLTYKAANSRYRPGETNLDWTVGGMPRR